MAKLTAEMKTFLASGRDPVTVFVGTAANDGMPNISAKGTFIQVVDDQTLAYADVYSLKTMENLKHNPKVVIAVVNTKTYKGYQFKGTGEIVDKGGLPPVCTVKISFPSRAIDPPGAVHSRDRLYVHSVT